jgi:uncharacterized protein
MKRFLSLAVLLCLLVVGCQKNASVDKTPSTVFEPTQAQPKLPTMKLWLGAEEMPTEIATTADEVQTGMMFRTSMEENAGMLFVFPYTMKASFWMKNCPLPLSAAYIDPEGRILEIHDLEPHNTNAVLAASDQVQFVLETNRDWFKKKNIGVGTIIRTERGTLQETFFRR